MPNLPSQPLSPDLSLPSVLAETQPYENEERALRARTLAAALGCFSDAARSLEQSYESLRAEVARLRRDLETSDAGRERAEDEARRSRTLAEISSVLAHEIRNPLASMELFTGLLLDAPLSRECREWALHLQAGLRTLWATVNNVLDFHAPAVCIRGATDMGQLLDDVSQFVAPQAATCGTEVTLRNGLRGVVVTADRTRMHQVLLNLVLNALRAMTAGGSIEISGRKEESSVDSGEEVMMRVTDTGPGIAAENLSKVFEAGFSTHPGSPGLGLAVCRRIVVQHRGTILARSRAGEGTTLEVWIPINPNSPSAPAPHSASLPASLPASEEFA